MINSINSQLVDVDVIYLIQPFGVQWGYKRNKIELQIMLWVLNWMMTSGF